MVTSAVVLDKLVDSPGEMKEHALLVLMESLPHLEHMGEFDSIVGVSFAHKLLPLPSANVP
ncbi:MAG: hypothetical protein KDK99_19560 [Verrucomicrobiales bacterium]|nr:hypothetical protein [Verrucomicrobiales bacterium]